MYIYIFKSICIHNESHVIYDIHILCNSVYICKIYHKLYVTIIICENRDRYLSIPAVISERCWKCRRRCGGRGGSVAAVPHPSPAVTSARTGSALVFTLHGPARATASLIYNVELLCREMNRDPLRNCGSRLNNYRPIFQRGEPARTLVRFPN